MSLTFLMPKAQMALYWGRGVGRVMKNLTCLMPKTHSRRGEHESDCCYVRVFCVSQNDSQSLTLDDFQPANMRPAERLSEQCQGSICQFTNVHNSPLTHPVTPIEFISPHQLINRSSSVCSSFFIFYLRREASW